MTDQIKNILFPTDFSDNARRALPFALDIARKTGATLHIMHSIEEPYDFAPMVEDVKKGVTRKVQRLFDDMIDDIRNSKKDAELQLKTRIQTGRAIYAILEESENLSADLVVMGTRGRSGIEKFLIGGTTAQVIQLTKTPVLAIPETVSENGFGKILFATDYHGGDLKALQFVANLGKLYDSEITVFHIATDRELKDEILFRGFRELVNESITYPTIGFRQTEGADLPGGILEEMEHNNISLVVMVRYKKPFALFGKKRSKDMSYQTTAPLLVIPGTEVLEKA